MTLFRWFRKAQCARLYQGHILTSSWSFPQLSVNCIRTSLHEGIDPFTQVTLTRCSIACYSTSVVSLTWNTVGKHLAPQLILIGKNKINLARHNEHSSKMKRQQHMDKQNQQPKRYLKVDSCAAHWILVYKCKWTVPSFSFFFLPTTEKSADKERRDFDTCLSFY